MTAHRLSPRVEHLEAVVDSGSLFVVHFTSCQCSRAPSYPSAAAAWQKLLLGARSAAVPPFAEHPRHWHTFL